MQPVTPPPVKNPLDLILAKLHVATNGFFLQLPNIVGGIVLLFVAYFPRQADRERCPQGVPP